MSKLSAHLLSFIRCSSSLSNCVIRASCSSPGLFGISRLQSPQDYKFWAKDARDECESIRHQIYGMQNASTVNTQIIDLLDRMSDILCKVIDSAELCRNTHSDASWSQAADEAHSILSNFISELNSDRKLYETLMRLISNPTVFSSLTTEQKRTAAIFRQDFERGGIHLGPSDRKQVIDLNDEILRLGSSFFSNLQGGTEEEAEDAEIFVPYRPLQGKLPKQVLDRCALVPYSEIAHIKRLEKILPTDPVLVINTEDSHLVNMLLKSCPDSNIRKQIYLTVNSHPKANVPVLDRLLAARHKLADTMGFESYSHFAGADRIIHDPRAVDEFLQRLSDRIRPKAQQEAADLLTAKQEMEGPNSGPLSPWDVTMYTGMLRTRRSGLTHSSVSRYFPVSSCLAGLLEISNRLFGIRFEEQNMNKNESWAAGVKKLVMYSEGSSDPKGIVYLDLHARRGKLDQNAHFTIQCGTPGSIPVVALVLNIAPEYAPQASSSQLNSTYLSQGDVETFFHEWGHALHSLLSQTNYQNVSGTRTVLDLAETPSHLFEHFASDFRSLSLFAAASPAVSSTSSSLSASLLASMKNGGNPRPIPQEMVEAMASSKRMFAALDLQTQIGYAAMDLSFHSYPWHSLAQKASPASTSSSLFSAFKSAKNASTSLIDTQETLRAVRQQYLTVLCPNEHKKEEANSVPLTHASFNHFVGYGANYSSYLFARLYSSNIWQGSFAQDPLSRQAGDRYRQALLQHGAAKEPLEMIAAAMGAKVNAVEEAQSLVLNEKHLLRDLGIQ